MNSVLWISIALLAIFMIAGILLTLLAWNRKKKGITLKTNYRTFFIMGLVMFPVGLIGMIISLLKDYPITIMLPFFIIGIVYLAIGWEKRETWKKSE